MSIVSQLSQILRTLPKSQADWEQVIVQLNQWRAAIQGMTWQPITLQNGWTAYGSVYAPPQYYIDASGRLFCRGLIQSGTVTDGTVLFNLPFAPSYEVVTIAQAHTTGSTYAPVRLDVLKNGNVAIYNAASISWVSLDQLHFSLIQ